MTGASGRWVKTTERSGPGKRKPGLQYKAPRGSSSFAKSVFILTHADGCLNLVSEEVPANKLPALVIWNWTVRKPDHYLMDIWSASRLRVALFGESVPEEHRNDTAILWAMALKPISTPLTVFPDHLRFFKREDGFIHYEDGTVFRQFQNRKCGLCDGKHSRCGLQGQPQAEERGRKVPGLKHAIPWTRSTATLEHYLRFDQRPLPHADKEHVWIEDRRHDGPEEAVGGEPWDADEEGLPQTDDEPLFPWRGDLPAEEEQTGGLHADNDWPEGQGRPQEDKEPVYPWQESVPAEDEQTGGLHGDNEWHEGQGRPQEGKEPVYPWQESVPAEDEQTGGLHGDNEWHERQGRPQEGKEPVYPWQESVPAEDEQTGGLHGDNEWHEGQGRPQEGKEPVYPWQESPPAEDEQTGGLHADNNWHEGHGTVEDVEGGADDGGEHLFLGQVEGASNEVAPSIGPGEEPSEEQVRRVGAPEDLVQQGHAQQEEDAAENGKARRCVGAEAGATDGVQEGGKPFWYYMDTHPSHPHFLLHVNSVSKSWHRVWKELDELEGRTAEASREERAGEEVAEETGGTQEPENSSVPTGEVPPELEQPATCQPASLPDDPVQKLPTAAELAVNQIMASNPEWTRGEAMAQLGLVFDKSGNTSDHNAATSPPRIKRPFLWSEDDDWDASDSGSEEGPEEMMAPIESVPSSGEASEKNPFPLPFADDEDEEPEQEHTEEEPQTEEPVPDDIEGSQYVVREDSESGEDDGDHMSSGETSNAEETSDCAGPKKRWTADQERRLKVVEANHAWLIGNDVFSSQAQEGSGSDGTGRAPLISFSSVAEYQDMDEWGFFFEGVERTKTEAEQEENRRKKELTRLAAKLAKKGKADGKSP